MIKSISEEKQMHLEYNPPNEIKPKEILPEKIRALCSLETQKGLRFTVDTAENPLDIDTLFVLRDSPIEISLIG